MSPWWLLPAGAVLVAVSVLTVHLRLIADEARALRASAQRLERAAVAADELERMCGVLAHRAARTGRAWDGARRRHHAARGPSRLPVD